MHSELVCLGSDGKLYQWKWSDPEPFKFVDESGLVLTHPRSKSLSLLNENVIKLSACSSRASVATASGKVSQSVRENRLELIKLSSYWFIITAKYFCTLKVATWLDETLSAVASKLEHSAKVFSDLEKEKIHELYTCPLYTCVQTVAGSLYWWYVHPTNCGTKRFCVFFIPSSALHCMQL